MICIFALSLIPLLIMGFYDFPSADDFSMALQPHQYFMSTGNFFGTFLEAVKKAYWIYMNYEGYFFSAFLTCLCPAVFGEQFYFLVPFIVIAMLIFGVCYFMDAFFVRALKLDKSLTTVVSMTTLIIMIQFIKDSKARAEGFYWWSGAVNYVFTFGMAFFWAGLLFRILYDENKKACMRKFIWACFWALFMGGANYMTALELAIISTLVLFVCVMNRFSKIIIKGLGEVGKRFAKLIWIPAVINLVSFGLSVKAPGLNNRIAEASEGYSPIKSVLLSLYGTYNVIIDEMARWETLVALMILIPIFWELSKGLKNKLSHPFVFLIFAYGMVSSNMTPLYFGVGNFDSGRVVILAWMEFVFFAIMTVFYITAWVRSAYEEKITGIVLPGNIDVINTSEKRDSFSWQASSAMLALTLILLFGSVLCIAANPHYYSVTSALYELVSGKAEVYKDENAERLRILRDDSIKDAVIKPHEDAPEILFYQDINESFYVIDPETGEYLMDEETGKPQTVWINGATALYYEKDSLELSKE